MLHPIKKKQFSEKLSISPKSRQCSLQSTLSLSLFSFFLPTLYFYPFKIYLMYSFWFIKNSSKTPCTNFLFFVFINFNRDRYTHFTLVCRNITDLCFALFLTIIRLILKMSPKCYFFLGNPYSIRHFCQKNKINRGDKYACEYIEYNGKTVHKNKPRMWPQKFYESQTIHLKYPFTELTKLIHQSG